MHKLSYGMILLCTGCFKSASKEVDIPEPPMVDIVTYTEEVFLSEQDLLDGYRQFAFTLQDPSGKSQTDDFCMVRIDASALDKYPEAWVSPKASFTLPVSLSNLPSLFDNLEYASGERRSFEDCFLNVIDEFALQLEQQALAEAAAESEVVQKRQQYTPNDHIFSEEVLARLMTTSLIDEWYVEEVKSNTLPSRTQDMIFGDIVRYLQLNLPDSHHIRYGSSLARYRDQSVVVSTTITKDLPNLTISIDAKTPTGEVFHLYKEKMWIGFQPSDYFHATDTVIQRDINGRTVRVPSYCVDLSVAEVMQTPECQVSSMTTGSTQQVSNITESTLHEGSKQIRQITVDSGDGYFYLEMEFENTKEYAQVVRIPRGTIFRPVNNGKQVAVASEDVEFTINGHEKIVLKLRVYCNNVNLSGPSGDSYVMTSMRLSDDLLQELNSTTGGNQKKLWTLIGSIQ